MGRITKTFQAWCEEQGAYELLRCYEAGGNLLPADLVGFSAAAKVNFRCPACQYEWSRRLNKATRKGAKLDCPVCNGRVRLGTLAERYPELAAQWDYEKNEEVPEAYQPARDKERVHWVCGQCRNRWSAVIRDRIQSAERVRRRGGELCPFCGHQKVSPTYNLAVLYRDVARQWDYLKNEGKRPEECFPYGNQRVWWKCDFDPSHSWQDVISNRTTLRRGCPRCGRLFPTTYTSRVLFYYLRQVFPDCVCEYPEGKYHLDICLPSQRIAIEHHGSTHWRKSARERDARRRRELLNKGYRHVIWLVESEEPLEEYIREEDVLHYYDPSPHYKMDKLVCYVLDWLRTLTGGEIYYESPDFVRDHYKIEQAYYHERKKRSVAATHPELADEWGSQNVSPADAVLAGSNRKVWWKCVKCGREFQATVASRTGKGSGCPYCRGLLPTEENNAAVRFPHLVEEWDQDENDKSLCELLPNTKYLAAWICKDCGYRWKSMLPNRTGKSGGHCPNCKKRVTRVTCARGRETIKPELAAFWCGEKNGAITPDMVAAQSNKRFWWRCERGHVWQGAPNKMSKMAPSRYCPYCSNRKVCLENCLETAAPHLAAEWHTEKNGDLTPRDVTFSSPKKVWWRCGHGHTFYASVYGRHIKGTGCPYCINLKVCEDNCLSAKYPDLAKEWHPTRNAGLTPRDVTANSTKEVWWYCEHGHEWQEIVRKRSVRGYGCPYCSGRRVAPETCLAEVNPRLAAEWHPEKNGDLTPWDVMPSSGRKVWWQCENGHEWRAAISNRSKGRGCRQCADRRRKGITFAEAPAELVAQWNRERNPLPPSAYAMRSNKKVWWRCDKGHEWEATPDARTSGSGCPYCAGRLPTEETCLHGMNPALAAEWDQEANGTLTPRQVFPHSKRRAGWKCSVCGHRWTAPIAYRTNGSGCPACREKRSRKA